MTYRVDMRQNELVIRERPQAEVLTIDGLVKRARQGDFRMPRFQRAFRWNAQDVNSLFDSIWRGFPIGSLLLWDRPAPTGEVSFGSFTVEQAAAMTNAQWVVDGQQRLTALVATLTEHDDPLRRSSCTSIWTGVSSCVVERAMRRPPGRRATRFWRANLRSLRGCVASTWYGDCRRSGSAWPSPRPTTGRRSRRSSSRIRERPAGSG
jgi:hypothetical protein